MWTVTARRTPILLSACFLFVACGILGPSQQAKDTLLALEDIESGFSVGMSLMDFKSRLRVAKSKYDRLLREEPAYRNNKAGFQLCLVFRQYVLLSEVWDDS